MSNKLIFYTNPMSRGRIARWMLEETGAAYETQVLDYGTTMKGADYLAINPMGKVPAIKHGDTIVTETAAICCYLADAFPDAKLAPTPGERGAYYRWMFFTAGPVEQATVNRALGFVVPEGKDAMAGYGSYEATSAALEQALDTDGYVCGDRFTAADVYIGMQIGFGLQFGSIDARPAFEAYWERVKDRDGYRRATEIDDALMPKDAG